MFRVTGAKVGDPDLPTREQVEAWVKTLRTCNVGVVNCVMKHKTKRPRYHDVEEVCYLGPVE
jgi:hypothetical protein